MYARRIASSRDARRFGRFLLRKGAGVADVSERQIDVVGGRIRVRLYRPVGVGPFPLHVFFHGGGFCVGDLDQRDNRCHDLATDVGCIVASVDYRLAPENTYPTPPEDGYRALCWLVDHADELGVDATRVSIGGESAGGNLAAVVALMARDRIGPRIVFQLLDVPTMDLTLSQPSVRELADGYVLTRAEMESFVEQYLVDAAQASEPYASPLFAGDLTGLPPAMVTTAEFDPLRDEGEAYARPLEEAGVPVDARRLDGHIHASFAFTRLLESARDHHRTCVAALKRAFE